MSKDKEEVKEEKKVPEVNTEELFSKLGETLSEAIKQNSSAIEAKVAELINKKGEEKMAGDKKEEGNIQVVDSGVEKLIADLTAKLADQEKTISEGLESFQSELKEKADEIEALTKSKMNFEEKDVVRVSDSDIDTAVLIAKICGKSIDNTQYGKNLITKSNAEHWNSPTGDWESSFVTRVEDALRLELKIEPLFTKRINMTTPTMYVPTNPEAGVAEWVKLSALTPSFTPGSPDNQLSSGTEDVHQLGDITLVAQKLATKEYIGFEEEEDSLIPIIPIIRDSIVRRMARSTDIALLRGTGDTSSAQASGYDPIIGICKLADTAGNEDNTSLTISGGEKATVALLASMRKGLGNYGLDPSNVKYIVSPDIYYDLLDDPDFRTLDMVGDNATILKGQIGQANGSPVIVSGEFAAKADGAYGAVAVYTGNFIFGPYKSLVVERERQIVQQQNVLVSTRRFGFIPITASVGSYVLTYAA